MDRRLTLLVAFIALLACTREAPAPRPDVAPMPAAADVVPAPEVAPEAPDAVATPEHPDLSAPQPEIVPQEVEKVEPRFYDPKPVESPAAPVAETKTGLEKAPEQVVPFAEEVDPFARLEGPSVPSLEKGDPRADTLRLGPEPPPEPGEVAVPFPPKVEVPPPAEVKLPPMKVVRHYPDGKVDLVDRISVTFSHPMVPLAELEKLDRMTPPLTIEPEVPGRFVWLGTDTVAFEPEGRLPFGNRYTARVAAGVTSSLGVTLAEPYEFTVETPRPALVGSVPYDDAQEVTPDTTITLYFNADVEPEAVMPHLQLKDVENRVFGLKLVGRPAPDPEATSRVARDEDERKRRRSLVVRPEKPLPTGMYYVLTVGEGLTSTEGPLTADQKHFVRFATYYPLELKSISCSWGNDDCYPGSPVSIEFNNTLKHQPLEDRVTVSPAVENLRLRVQGNTIVAFGEFLPSQEYTVHVSMGIEDVHGQRNLKGDARKVRYREAWPFMRLARTGHFVIEAREAHEIDLVAMNLEKGALKLAYVPESEFIRALDKAGNYFDWDDEPTAGFQLMETREQPLTDQPNRIKRTVIDLDPGLAATNAVYGTVMLDVKARRSRGLFKGWDEFRQVALVQITDLGLTAAMSPEECHVLVTRLSTGEPLHRATVELIQQSSGKVLSTAYTGEDGMVRLPGPWQQKSAEGPYLVRAASGSDRVWLPLAGDVDAGDYQSSYYYAGERHSPELTGLVFAERGLYRPAEEVHLSVVARLRERGPDADVVPLKSSQRAFRYTVHDPRWNELASGTVTLSPFGTGSFTVKTAGNAPLGTYSVTLEGSGGSLGGSFELQEYRTPEYEVGVRWATGGENILVGRTLDAVVNGEYYFGAPMNGAEVDWTLTRTPTSYTPPDNPGFTFSDIDPEPESRYGRWHRFGRHASQEHVLSGAGRLDAQGRLTVPIELDPGEHRRNPLSFTLEAQVYDQNRQSIAGRATVLAHRAERYVGLALDRSVVAARETVEVTSVVTRYDGSRYDDAEVQVVLFSSRWMDEETVSPSGEVEYEYKYEEKEVARCSLRSGVTPGRCLLTVPAPGRYVVRAETRDLADRPVRAAVNLYAYGDELAQWTPDPENRVDLVLDRKEYEAGDTVKLLVQSPFARATGLLTVSREGFAQVRPIRIDSPSTLVEIELKERWIPGVQVGVALVRGRTLEAGSTPDDRGRPAFAHGNVAIPISRAVRRIDVGIEPAARAVSPGAPLDVLIRTTGPDGKPVSANVAFMVVDEGVLSLIGYATPNPLAAIYRLLGSGTGFKDLRPLVLPRIRPKVEFESAEPEEEGAVAQKMMAEAPAGGMPAPAMRSTEKSLKRDESKAKKRPSKGGKGDDDAGPAFALRQFFKSTAWFDGSLRTGKDGLATVRVTMPDNLTEFRIMAVAADAGILFGSADAQVRTRRPLVVRPSLPRFLNFGDRFEAAAVVNNQTGFDTDVMVRCLAANATVEEQVRTVRVPHGEAREVRFPARAGEPGPATFQFAAVALTEARDSDAAELTIPTLIPATSEAFATYGVVDEATRQPLQPPTHALPDFGGLDVSLSSTALTGLQDSVRYLFDYPYECTEQLCSRLLPVLSLGEILADFNLGEAATPERAAALVKEGIERLYLRQLGDGGFTFWPGGEHSWLYISAYAAMTLQMAAEHGHAVDPWRLDRVYDFLESRLDSPYKWESTAYGSQAMAALVLVRGKRDCDSHLQRLYDLAVDKEALTLYARAWLLEAMALDDGPWEKQRTELYRQLANAAVETASAVHFSEGRHESLRLMMHSEDRTDAIVLHALLVANPEDALIEKVTRGLVRARVHGRWSTTQANAYALLALSRYYREFEKEVPDFTARLWHGQKTLATHRFKGREMTIAKSHVPMRELLAQAAGDLILAKRGPGRLYYRLGLKYAPADLRLDAEDRGFLVERVYLPEGKDGELRRREDGAWVAKAGTYVRVRLRVVAPDQRYYVAVVDPLPAGLEAVNEAFQTSATQRLGGAETETWPSSRRWWYRWNPWDYEERRDDRVQLFADRMYGGTYEYTYVARATAIGTFVVPPTRAEEMYQPETFGRSASETFVIEE